MSLYTYILTADELNNATAFRFQHYVYISILNIRNIIISYILCKSLLLCLLPML